MATMVSLLVAFYCACDLPYTVLHRMLHHRSIYRHIHKHHHRQIVPTRGNYDAINMHPCGFVVGEYMHLLFHLANWPST